MNGWMQAQKAPLFLLHPHDIRFVVVCAVPCSVRTDLIIEAETRLSLFVSQTPLFISQTPLFIFETPIFIFETPLFIFEMLPQTLPTLSGIKPPFFCVRSFPVLWR